MSTPAAPIYRDPKVAVAVIIADDRGILLQQRAMEPRLGLWTFPSGYVDRGEQVERAAEREVAEELGLAVRLTHLLGVYSEPGRDTRHHTISVVYTAQAEDLSKLAAGDDAAQAVFHPVNALPPLAFDHARIVGDYLRHLENLRPAHATCASGRDETRARKED